MDIESFRVACSVLKNSLVTDSEINGDKDQDTSTIDPGPEMMNTNQVRASLFSRNHLQIKSIFIDILQWRIQDFPWGGGGRGLSRRLRFENFVCQNERIWTPLDPPMHYHD